MTPDLASRLLDSTTANLDSRSEWGHAQRFFYQALRSVHSQLPTVVQEQLARRGAELPSPASLEAARVVLWRSIQSDQMGRTRDGAAVRAALFAFYPDGEEDGPYDNVAYFCDFFAEARLPEEALIKAFREQWLEK